MTSELSKNRKILRAYLLGISFLLLAMVFALKVGSVLSLDLDLITQLRVPRVILASAIGMGLSVAGASLQALFTNPLCEPYTLGISSGSAFGAVLGASLGLDWAYGGLLGTSFGGALVFSAVLYLISLKANIGNLILLLAGVMLSFLGSSMVAVWMTVADSNGIQGALSWLLGDLSRARASGATLSLGLCILLFFLVWTQSRVLDALLMGEEGALTLGVPVDRVRRKLIVLTSLLVAICVSGGGMIGFIGLVVPHFVRKSVGSLHFHLLPLCAIWGAAILTAADGCARFVARPYELPVGVVTALVGAPLFLWMMLQRREAT